MSLATRCPACGTIFRVVQDQLRVSEGWVRCGRCSEVFNAVESLFDLERDPAPAWTARAQATPEPTAHPPAADASPPHASAPWPEPAAAPPQDDPYGWSAPSRSGGYREPAGGAQAPAYGPGAEDVDAPGQAPGHGPASATPPAPTAWDDLSPTVYAPGPDLKPPPPAPAHHPMVGLRRAEPQFDDAAGAPAPASLPAADGPAFVDAPAAAPTEAEAEASFVRRADRAARWHTPGMRLALGAAALLLAAAAALQAAHAFRDEVAARWPASVPVLTSMCGLLGCELNPRRHAAALSVEGSGLTRLEAGNRYRLSIVLRNRDATALLLPSIDLTLTDAQGDVVSRKVVAPAELGASQPTIGAGAELALEGLLEAGERRLAGYSIQLFYP